MRSIKASFLFSFVIILSTVTQAQFSILSGNDANILLEGASLIRFDESRNVPVYAEFYQNNSLTKESIIHLLKEQSFLSAEHDFKLKSSRKDQLGFTHDKYAQLYKGVEYAYVNLTVHSKNGQVVSFSGNFSSVLPTNSTDVVDLASAFKTCIDEIAAEEYYDETAAERSADVVYLRTINKKDEIEIKRCYRFNVYAKSPLSRNLLFVDTKTGEIEFVENLIHTGSSEGKAKTVYSDTQNITTDSTALNFRLIDTTRGNGVETFNCQTTKNYATAIDFTDADNFWDNVNTDLDQYATDAHWATEMMYDYLFADHGYNSIDNLGFALKSYMHYDVDYVNAFWDGQRMTYGDGDQNTEPFVSLDIVGHEISHGLTEFSAGLIYANESGALNESFSDIFGTSLEFFVDSSGANWSLGEGIGSPLRSVSNPKLYNDPDTYNGQFWVDQDCIPTKGNDKCGVHTNSGVQNRWFYLVAVGDSGVNDLADTFNVKGIGIKKAASISFRSLTNYLSASSNYVDARFFSIISAVDLFGACSPEVEAVTNGWYAVGVGGKYVNQVTADFTAVYDTNYCTVNETIHFESTGTNVIDFRWYFGNGDTSNLRNPSTDYTNQGSYDVKLIADGGTCGSDTIDKINYISLDTNMSCAYTLDDVSSQRVNECKGKLMDSGGINKDYKVNENGVFIIDVPNADYIELSIIDLSILGGEGFNCNKDYLEIYDGDSVTSPSLGRFCRNYLPTGNLIQSSTNKLCLRFHSDDLVTDSGFLLSWECKLSNSAPIAEFELDMDTSCTGLVQFFNKTINGVNKLKWDFGDGAISNLENPIHEYKVNGNYDVKLVVENSIGLDSIIKNSVVIISRPAAPVVSIDTFCIGEDAGLKVNSSETIEWYRDTSLNSVFIGDSVTFFNIKKDTTLYFREVSNEQKFNGGALLNSIGAGDYSNDNDYIEFDVHEAININRILFFSDRAGTRTMDVRNNKGEIVVSKEVYISSGALFVTLNVALQPDTNYRISFSSRNTELYKNTAGANFPYNISNLVTLKGSNGASGEYPFFYRWSVSRLSCVSNFKTATAHVDTSCVITSLEDQLEAHPFRVYPNPVKDELLIESGKNSMAVQKEFKLYSATGRLVYNFTSNSNEPIYRLNLESFTAGVYYLRINDGGDLSTFKIVKLD